MWEKGVSANHRTSLSTMICLCVLRPPRALSPSSCPCRFLAGSRAGSCSIGSSYLYLLVLILSVSMIDSLSLGELRQRHLPHFSHLLWVNLHFNWCIINHNTSFPSRKRAFFFLSLAPWCSLSASLQLSLGHPFGSFFSSAFPLIQFSIRSFSHLIFVDMDE